MKHIFIAMLCIASSLTFSQEKETSNLWTSSRPDGHAPISVMADHVHHKDEFMFSYRYMTMDMRYLQEGNSDATNTDAFANYMVAPQNMTMQMHMLGGMYAPSDKLTLMIMANYIENVMGLTMRTGTDFSTNSNGYGDVSVGALYSIFNKNRQAMHTQLSILIPTGSIEKKGATPMSMGTATQLPYAMQTGSGSFGTKLGLTYLGQADAFSWGHQINALIYLNDNNQDYILGNRYNLNNWFAAKAGNNLSVSVRLEGVLVDKIKGQSPLLNPMMVTTADTQNSGGTHINTGFGLNYSVINGSFKGLRFATECALPIYQDLNGIQLKQNYNLTFGMQYAFH
ncbi:transporter [Mariniflexile sp. AS56]|uniref:transporter n=1 Tax=Mariniflexile sp. AS56 TaxID=3063957 RepID=UPI0026F13E31|nr:transporter [Mariniflexile sp. AS56]MDO7170912.1 transporter [Mariniflexile sp. AS56]